MHNEGGVHGVKKQQERKGLVGSTYVTPQENEHKVQHSLGYGNQAAPSLPPSAHFYNAKDAQKEKLLVGSFPVDTRTGNHPNQPHGYGNQAAGSLPPSAHFYNAKDAQKEKLLVGSTFVDPRASRPPTQPYGIGNQAAAGSHGINDVGTNIVFHGVYS